jgi:hypothetical protein
MSDALSSNEDRSIPPRPEVRESVILRSWPKIVMMWPTLLLSLACAIVMSMYSDLDPKQSFGLVHLLNLVFLLVLAFNLMLILYDLDLRGFLVLVMVLAVMVMLVFMIDYRRPQTWEKIGRLFSIRVWANSAFYSLFSIVLIINLVIAWVITRFNYWKVEHNEIIIHRGFMHEQERHPTAQARFTLVVDDIVEYAILGAGKLVFTFADDSTKHELTTVPFAHSQARKLDLLLGRLAVTQT